ncbi:hypothetical protein OROHE_014435 [Orobanche hederae]
MATSSDNEALPHREDEHQPSDSGEHQNEAATLVPFGAAESSSSGNVAKKQKQKRKGERRIESEPSKKKRRGETKKGKKMVEEEDSGYSEETEESEERADEQPRRPLPYEKRLNKWVFKRKDLAYEHHRIMLTGGENTVKDIRSVLESFSKQTVKQLRHSTIGAFMKLPDTVSRSGKALHYMISRQVTPKPEVDETALWFNPTSPTEYPEIQSSQSFLELLIAYIRTKFINKKFELKKVEVKGSEADYLKMAKVLLACLYVLGLDPNKNKVPEWMWALVEDDEAWEEFPWGGYAYQILIQQIDVVKKDIHGPYHLKGNTIAFLAWIHEAIPTVGRLIGGQDSNEFIPRMMRYKYMSSKGMPNFSSKELVAELNPTDKEKETAYWKSLEKDPEKKPFAFQYDPNDNMKKRKRDLDEDEDVAADPNAASTSTAAPVNPPLVPSNIQYAEDRATFLKEIGEYAGSVATKSAKIEVEALLRTQQEQMLQAMIQWQKEQHQQLVEAVGDYIFKKLLEVEAHKGVQSDRLQKATPEAAVATTTLPQMTAAASPSLAQEMLAPGCEGTKEGERPKQHSQQPIEPVSKQV